MAHGIVDLIVSKQLTTPTLLLTLNGGGLSNDLHQIPGGAEAILNRSPEWKVTVLQEQASVSECPFPTMELDAATARAFGLRSGQRLVLHYDPATNELRMQRLNRSRAIGRLLRDSRRRTVRTLVIGYSLLRMLGIPEKRLFQLTLRKGKMSGTFRLLVPSNELDNDMRLSGSDSRRFGLSPGKRLRLEYDTKTRTLHIQPPAASGSLVTSTRRSHAPHRTTADRR